VIALLTRSPGSFNMASTRVTSPSSRMAMLRMTVLAGADSFNPDHHVYLYPGCFIFVEEPQLASAS
jgi:hypothetical protein